MRGRVKDGSPKDSQKNDHRSSLDNEKRNIEKLVAKELKICRCGWSKLTIKKGLKIH